MRLNDIPSPGRDSDASIFNQFVAHYDVPAYVRRALRVQEMYEHLLAQCRAHRNELLSVVRAQLGVLQARAGDWSALRPFLSAEDQLDTLRQLAEALQPRLRGRIEMTDSSRILRRDLTALCRSLERFNRRWLAYLNEVDLAEINGERERYNRYYLLEKECAMRSARLAREGFQKLPPLDAAALAEVVPPLPVPLLRGGLL